MNRHGTWSSTRHIHNIIFPYFYHLHFTAAPAAVFVCLQELWCYRASSVCHNHHIQSFLGNIWVENRIPQGICVWESVCLYHYRRLLLHNSLSFILCRVTMSNLNHVKLFTASYERLLFVPFGEYLIECDRAVATTENTEVMSSSLWELAFYNLVLHMAGFLKAHCQLF